MLPVQGTLLAGQYGVGLIIRHLLTPNEILHSPWLYANVWVGLAMIVMLWPSFAVMAKRLHDCDMIGAFALPIFKPLLLAMTVSFISANLVLNGHRDTAMGWLYGVG